MLPDGMRYSRSHMWARQKGEKVVIGVTEYLTEGMDEIVLVSLPKAGEEVEQDDVFGCMECPGTVLDLVAPVSGEVMRVNVHLKENPGVILDDPYGDGWIMEVETFDNEEFESLLNPEEYESDTFNR